MPILFFKSVLSLGIFFLTIFSMFTMFEVFGRAERKYNIESLKKVHRASGIIYSLLYIVIAYFCFSILISSKVELSPRSALHSVLAFAVVLLLALKVSFVRIYRQYYNQAKVVGIVVALISLLMVWTSGGYYLLVTEFGRYRGIDRIMEYRMKGFPGAGKGDAIMNPAVRTDEESIRRGEYLFNSRCSFCHDPNSRDTIVGPGLKGILRERLLPASRRPAVAENIRKQLREPFDKMPSFAYLSRDEVEDIIAYLNTL